MILATQTLTIWIVCPLMSLVATIFIKNGLNANILATWIQTVATNFPMAFFWQIFFAGPFVKSMVGSIGKLEKSLDHHADIDAIGPSLELEATKK